MWVKWVDRFSVAFALDGNHAAGDLVLRQTSPLLLCKSSCPYDTSSMHINEKSREVNIRARRSPASFATLKFRNWHSFWSVTLCEMVKYKEVQWIRIRRAMLMYTEVYVRNYKWIVYVCLLALMHTVVLWRLCSVMSSENFKPSAAVNYLSLNRPYFSCVLSYQAFDYSEAGGDLALIRLSGFLI